MASASRWAAASPVMPARRSRKTAPFDATTSVTTNSQRSTAVARARPATRQQDARPLAVDPELDRVRLGEHEVAVRAADDQHRHLAARVAREVLGRALRAGGQVDPMRRVRESRLLQRDRGPQAIAGPRTMEFEDLRHATPSGPTADGSAGDDTDARSSRPVRCSGQRRIKESFTKKSPRRRFLQQLFPFCRVLDSESSCRAPPENSKFRSFREHPGVERDGVGYVDCRSFRAGAGRAVHSLLRQQRGASAVFTFP